ncbi:hypothetical protein EDD18DRAFT_1101903 [Armillaria luteobubalina]|uniref:Uncharacterized protein n=1 Tax=Armillaria luteobubalina TaxID=153913 RepID=A0AA39QG44_9AGAR|nr:hypothetical protein EDD18DRAFT_1101903 [Armillaria luteobubalina]
MNVPVHMHLQEHVSYAGGDIVPTGANVPVPSCYEDADKGEEEDMGKDNVDSLHDVEMASEGKLDDDGMPLTEDESRPKIDHQHLLDKFDQSMCNTYFPQDVAFQETINGGSIKVMARGQEYVYENWNGSESMTKIKGRFHNQDTCISCAICNHCLSSLFFFGYIVDGKNFFGNWRVMHEDLGMPAWEARAGGNKAATYETARDTLIVQAGTSGHQK